MSELGKQVNMMEQCSLSVSPLIHVGLCREVLIGVFECGIVERERP
jgi:hypothetical protein